jgi:hypothetical protein
MMNEEMRHAIKFSAEVDVLLAGNGRQQYDRVTTGDNELLTLADRLRALDLMASKELHLQLRRELLHRLETQGAKQLPRWSIPRLLPIRPRWALWAMVALVVLLVLLSYTPAARAGVGAVQAFLRELHWPNTSAVQMPEAPATLPAFLVELKARFEREETAGRAWSYSFEDSDFGSCCADGMRNEVVSLDQAMDETGGAILLPTFVPAGYVLAEVRLLGLPPYDVFTIYEGPAGRLGLYQSPVGARNRKDVNENTVVLDLSAIRVGTTGTLEEVKVGDVTAALLEGSEVVWEESGTSFHLIGPGLDTETLVKIAESLEPGD